MPKVAVSRSQVICQPVEEVYSKIRDFRSWPEWSPWLIADPECHLEFGDDRYSWEGEVCGSGQMEVMDEKINEMIDYDLTFLKPFKSRAKVRMSFKEMTQSCKVTWTMDSSLPFFLFWMRKSMEGFIGLDYERGLSMLRDLMESGNVPSKLSFDGKQTFPGMKVVGMRRECSIDDIEDSVTEVIRALRKTIQKGRSICSYRKWNVSKRWVSYFAGIEVEDVPTELPEGREFTEIPACSIYSLEHVGPFRHLANAWSSGMMHGRAKKFKHQWKIPPFEICEDPDGENPVVRICLPCK